MGSGGSVRGSDRLGFRVRLWPAWPIWKGVREGRIGDEIAGQGCARMPDEDGTTGTPVTTGSLGKDAG